MAWYHAVALAAAYLAVTTTAVVQQWSYTHLAIGDPWAQGEPEQLHIAFGETVDSMTVAWKTYVNTSAQTGPNGVGAPSPAASYLVPTVWYGHEGSSEDTWTELPAWSWFMGDYIAHHALMVGLTPGASYTYRVGWGGGQTKTRLSKITQFNAQRDENDVNWAPRIALFGDLGYTDDQIVNYLGRESNARTVDMIILFGDMIYYPDAIGDYDSPQNYLMRDLSSLTGNGSIPLHVTPGNGDSGGNFSIYRHNFFMPQWEQYDSLWHSFNIGRAKIIGVSTEVFYYQSLQVQENMIRWMRAELEAANTPEARKKRPWIIVHYHRPTYCTSYGYPAVDAGAMFEPIMYEFGVDLVFSGHEHVAERSFPAYNGSRPVGPDPTRPYHDAWAPVYIVSGNPGCAEEVGPFVYGMDRGTSAWRTYAYGYSHVTVINETTLHLDYLSTGLGKVIDDVYITKDFTCNFGPVCSGNRLSLVKEEKKLEKEPTKEDSKALLVNDVRAPVKGYPWPTHTCPGGVPQSQVNSLRNLFLSTGGASDWIRKDNWLVGDPCANDWFGVSCNPITDRVLGNRITASTCGITGLALPANNLMGPFPDLSALAPTLQILHLASNLFRGEIHPSVWNMPYLYFLTAEPKYALIPEFKLHGSMPDSLGLTLPNLRMIFLQNNALSGPLPSTIADLPCFIEYSNLTDPACHFIIDFNKFSGMIPPAISNVTWGNFYADHNDFTCPYPVIHAAYDSLDPCPNELDGFIARE